MTEEEPIFTLRADGLPLLQKGAERRDTSPRSHHDNRRIRVGGQTEIVGLLHINPYRLPGLGALSQKGRGEAETLALADDITDRVDRKRDPAGRRLMRGRDR